MESATEAGSLLGWHCAAVHVICVYGFRWSNFLSFRCEAVLRVFGFSGFNLPCFCLNRDDLVYETVRLYAFQLTVIELLCASL
jgi:hypothetical protein